MQTPVWEVRVENCWPLFFRYFCLFKEKTMAKPFCCFALRLYNSDHTHAPGKHMWLSLGPYHHWRDPRKDHHWRNPRKKNYRESTQSSKRACVSAQRHAKGAAESSPPGPAENFSILLESNLCCLTQYNLPYCLKFWAMTISWRKQYITHCI